jgi:GT2 family glycosyltransferase
MDTTVIIVAYKSEHLIEKNINKFHKTNQIIVIDNSQDESLKKNIESKYKNVNVILNENKGFSQAANLGARLAKTKYLFFCSPDNYVEKNIVNNLENISRNMNDEFGLLILSDEENFSEKNILIKETRGISCFLTQKKIFFNLNGFDENFFLYYEDVDLVKRFLNMGYKIYQVPLKYSSLSGSHNKIFNYPIEINRNWHYMWSKFYYYKKNFSYLRGIKETLGHFIKSIIKLIFFYPINKNKFLIYKNRALGLINSYLNKPSWRRPNLK